ncbi:STAS domain-containing protein [uncultured Jatrophihabitans sp.]|uniref:STAS domain-containing protein n=1 Tax=uncultured Jatrophihabitans sp. TaxID=1610747 RepID=UPI0035CC9DC0
MSAGAEYPDAGTGDVDGSASKVAVLRPEGDLDTGSVHELRERLDVVLNDDHVSTVVLDLTFIRFVDSSGLGALVEARLHAEATGTRLVLRNAGLQPLRLLRTTGAYDAFTWG